MQNVWAYLENSDTSHIQLPHKEAKLPETSIWKAVQQVIDEHLWQLGSADKRGGIRLTHLVTYSKVSQRLKIGSVSFLIFLQVSTNSPMSRLLPFAPRSCDGSSPLVFTFSHITASPHRTSCEKHFRRPLASWCAFSPLFQTEANCSSRPMAERTKEQMLFQRIIISKLIKMFHSEFARSREQISNSVQLAGRTIDVFGSFLVWAVLYIRWRRRGHRLASLLPCQQVFDVREGADQCQVSCIVSEWQVLHCSKWCKIMFSRNNNLWGARGVESER